MLRDIIEPPLPADAWDANRSELGRCLHRDPGDRVIVASARLCGAALLTHDRRIIDAGLARTLS